MSHLHRINAAVQRAALLFFVTGLLAMLYSLQPAMEPHRATFIALGMVDIVIAALVRWLPWARWHRYALLVVVPIAFVMIALSEVLGTHTPYTYPIFFMVIFIWVGLSMPPRTSLLLAPLTVIAYILPLVAVGADATAFESAVAAVPVCVLIGEVIANAVERLRTAQEALEQRVTERTTQLQAANAALVHELAERSQVELALRESELRFRQLAEHIHEVFWLVDLHRSALLYVSPAYEEIWQRSCASMYAAPQSFLEAVHPADLARVNAIVERQQRGEATDEEYRIIRPDGSIRWVWDRAFPVADAIGQVARIAGVTRDITEHKQLESQFLQSQKLEGIGRLAGGIAHDFNNLLMAIGGYASLLEEALPQDQLLRSDLEEIQKAVARAAGLTHQLLAFARKQIIEPRILNLNDLLGDMDKLLRRVIGEDIDLISRPAPNLAWVKADPGQIEQVILNLAVNARDSMPTGGKLTIETRNVLLDSGYANGHQGVTAGAYVLLAVSDTGSGMDAEVQAHAFEPFFTTKAQGQGTGLGLATCYGIVKQHGGNIWIYSEVGQGTTFKIYLPHVAEPAAVTPAPAQVQALSRGKETVLVVEDETAVRALAVRVLRAQGYTVLEAANGADAIQVAAAYAPAPIDLLVTDVVMPQLGGQAAAAQLLARYPSLRVLFISGYADSAIVHHGRLAEGVAFLHKPFTPAVLTGKVREVLDA